MARPYRPKRWRPEMPDPAGCYLLSSELGLSPVTAQVLYNRGLTTPALADDFLRAGREKLLDPFLLKDMDRAVTALQRRVDQGGPILVYGDYDADGVTGTAVLILALRALGATVDYYIPDRFSEGYGLNAGALRQLREQGHDFILSVDTGTTAVAEAEVARELGMTLVISDHHEPGPTLPEVAALVNPKRPDCTYPFKGLAGVGVAFKLAMALGAPNLWDLIDIVTLGTIADMVPLVEENRAIVREGLSALGATRRPGLRALMEVAGVREPVTATHVGFALGPRINALGRMGSAREGVELLLTPDPMRARELAEHLDQQNRARQAVEAAILEEALAQAESMPPEERAYALVLAGEGWHPGVVGICASRVLEAYHRPTILLSIEGDSARGSARSIPAFHMQKALLRLSDLFTKFGGHAAAAGMSLRSKDDIPELRRRLGLLAAEWLSPEDLIPEQRIDAFVRLDQVTDGLMRELALLEPHGIGNPAPVLAATDLAVLDSRLMGREQQHLKMLLRGDQTAPVEAVGWGMAQVRPAVGTRVHVAFQPEKDSYNGRERVRLTLKDLREACPAAPALTEEACLRWDPLAPFAASGTGAAQAAGTGADTQASGAGDVTQASGAGAGTQASGAGAGTQAAGTGADAQAAGTGADAQAPRVPAVTLDGRGDRLPELLTSLARRAEAISEVAATAERVDEAELDAAEEKPSRLAYVEMLAQQHDARVLLLAASPWAAAALADRLRELMPDRRQEVLLWLPGEPEPTAGAVVVAAHGQEARGPYTDVVYYHPPYQECGCPGERLHLLWEEADWALAEASLGWPYPEREHLVHLYKLLRRNEGSPERLAALVGEPFGPWNRLRWESGLTVFREVGLLGPDGALLPNGNGAKFDLESSPHYRRGLRARQRMAEARRRDR